MVDAIGLLGQVGVVRNHEDAGPLGQRRKMIDEVRGRFGIEVVARLIEDQKARASVIRCLWPPERNPPLSPTLVS